MRRMRHLARITIAVAALTAITSTLAPEPANAYMTWSDHHLTYGVSGQHFWLADSAVANNNDAIHSAISLWNATSTPIGYTETQTQSQSRMDFYHSTATNSGNCAITYLYIDTTDITNGGTTTPTRDWWWGKVTIYPDLKDTTLCGSSSHRAAVVAHEQGHVMGLAHAFNSDRLMYSGISGTNVNAPIQDDINGINHLY